MYVYLVECNSLIKVGISNEPQKRIAGMQTGCPLKLSLMGLFEFESREDAEAAEQLAHAELGASRLNGEWFSIDVEAATELMERLGGKAVVTPMAAKKLRKRQLRSRRDEVDDLVDYLADHISEMSEEDLLKLSAIHGSPTTDRRTIAERAAMLHVKRWRAA